jgi:preprotein translocase subunit SecF
MDIIGRHRLWLMCSGIILALSVAAVAVWGLKLGVDFRGGSLVEIALPGATTEEIRQALTGPEAAELGLEDLVVQPTDRGTFLLRLEPIDEATHQKLLARLTSLGAVEEKNFSSVGPTIGQDLKRRAVLAIALASLAIVLYLALSFRRVPPPVTSWRFGVIAVLTLLHDVMVVVGSFAVLGHFFGGFEVDSLFVVAALTVMGFSVHDTIVVFDRVREHLRKSPTADLARVVNTAVVETIARSLNTSLTVILVLLSLYLLGGASTRNFVLALMIGITFGTYSSIFIASPLLVVWQAAVDRRRPARAQS